MDIARKFTNLDTTACKLGVPSNWLKREAEAGRVPVLRAGRALLFNADLVESALIERSKTEPRTMEAAHA